MSFAVDTSGFNKLQRHLDRMRKNLQDLDGELHVSFEELFPPDFMRAHTAWPSMDEFIEGSGLVEGELDAEAFKEIPDAAWDDWIEEETAFSDWEEMQATAAQEWAKRRLMEGLE